MASTRTSLPDSILNVQPKLIEVTTHAKTAKWFLLGTQLELDGTALDGCTDMTRMYQLWIQEKAENATRKNLLIALRAINQNNDAKKYEDYLKTLTGEESTQTHSDVNQHEPKPTNTTDVLKSAPDKFKVIDLLADISSRWQTIGLALRVDSNTLSGIGRNNAQDSDAVKLDIVIEAWKNTRSSSYTWETLISAIGGRLVNHQAKVDEIRTYLASLPN